MRKITLVLDEETVRAGRAYARRHNMTLSSLIRKLLRQATSVDSKERIQECFALMDKARARPVVGKWRREELYRV